MGANEIIQGVRGMSSAAKAWVAASGIGIGAVFNMPDAALLAASVAAAAHAAVLVSGELTYENHLSSSRLMAVRGAGMVITVMATIGSIPCGDLIIAGAIVLAVVAVALDAVRAKISVWRNGGAECPNQISE